MLISFGKDIKIKFNFIKLNNSTVGFKRDDNDYFQSSVACVNPFCCFVCSSYREISPPIFPWPRGAVPSTGCIMNRTSLVQISNLIESTRPSPVHNTFDLLQTLLNYKLSKRGIKLKFATCCYLLNCV